MRHFDIPYKHAVLKGTIYGTGDPRIIFIHGASETGSARFDMLRQHLAKLGIASVAFDFVGHGQTGGDIVGSSLADRFEQARTVIDSMRFKKPLIFVGASMGADTAIRLTRYCPVATLILFVPAFYPRRAFSAPYTDAFHDAINADEDGWKQSDAWDILQEFDGSLLVIGAQNDGLIPAEIYDSCDDRTPQAHYKELYIVLGSPHRILPYLSDHPDQFAQVFERVYHVIVSSPTQ